MPDIDVGTDGFIVYAIRNSDGQFFCGGKSHGQKERWSESLTRTRFYHTQSIAQGQCAIMNRFGKNVNVVRLHLTITTAEEIQ